MTLLGDSPDRAYTHKLDRFNRFARDDLRRLIATLDIRSDYTILDAGCGTGLISQWLAEHTTQGHVLGVDLSHGHIEFARANLPAVLPIRYEQGDLLQLSLMPASFDGIWCSNTIHHLHNPVETLRHLLTFIRPGGSLWLGRSSFLPDMMFAWNERLEREVMAACYRYYRDKYNLSPYDTANSRNYVGWAQRAGGANIRVQTIAIDRIAPFDTDTEAYFLDVFFRGFWRNLNPYLSPEDGDELMRLTDPDSPDYCLKRPDFHHIQTYTLVTATCPPL